MNGCKLCHMSTKTYRAFIRKKYEEKQNAKKTRKTLEIFIKHQP